MRIIIQRVNQAKVVVDKKIVGQISIGVLVLFGVHKDDNKNQIPWLRNKLINLRMFHDDEGKMNLSLKDINGEILVVSQFTLYADCLSGRRPSFTETADPIMAEEYYNEFVKQLRIESSIKKVETGIFRAKMDVELINHGPVTFIIDAKDI